MQKTTRLFEAEKGLNRIVAQASGIADTTIGQERKH